MEHAAYEERLRATGFFSLKSNGRLWRRKSQTLLENIKQQDKRQWIHVGTKEILISYKENISFYHEVGQKLVQVCMQVVKYASLKILTI